MMRQSQMKVLQLKTLWRSRVPLLSPCRMEQCLLHQRQNRSSVNPIYPLVSFFVVWISAVCQCREQFLKESDKCTPDIGLCSLTSPKCLLQEDANAMLRKLVIFVLWKLVFRIIDGNAVWFTFRRIWAKYSNRVANVLLIGLEFAHSIQATLKKLNVFYVSNLKLCILCRC